MSADHTIVAGDSQPPFSRTLEYSDQSPVDLNGMGVTFQMRSMSAAAPVALTGSLTIVDAAEGQVSYTFSSTDTATSGNYLGKFVVTSGSDQMTFPTDGYLWIEVQPSLGSEPQQLVSLPDAKMALNITAVDRHVDLQLIRWIEASRPLIENITGPILMQQFEEWHDGGQNYIMLRRRPSSAYGTSPQIILIACSEYNGPIEWPLSIVASPDQGQMYSVMLDQRLARVVRRTAGGGVQPFPYMPQSVHVVYQAGQASIPENVRAATIETVRVHYETTMAVGRGSRTRADEPESGGPLPFFLPRIALELLSTNRRHPSLA